MTQTNVPPKPIVSFKDVDIVFGDNPESALPLIDQGRSRDEI
ncbi:MAG: choline ABC transporter ATP-binding protein, partial [Roseibium sp.]